MSPLNLLRAISDTPPVIKICHLETHEPTAAQTWFCVQVGKERGLRAVIPGRATVCSVITEKVTWAECEPFMNMHSCTWRARALAYGVRRGKGGGERGEKGRYLLDDRRVEAVKAAVQPDALKEKKNPATES